MEGVFPCIEYNDETHIRLPVLVNMLACESRMVPHVTVCAIDAWILAILVNAK